MTDNLIKISGFKFSGVSCGIKKTGDKDLGIIFSSGDALSAGVFTKNRVKAAPVKLDIRNIKNSITRAIVVNSGNANACTGEQGEKDAKSMAKLAAKKLGIKTQEVLISSTGVIGSFLPMDKVYNGIEKAIDALSEESNDDFLHAIMTTDAFPKKVYKKIIIDNEEINILGFAKGAGMICPNMATLLCYVVTDLNIDKKHLNIALKSAVDNSFNLITVDTDTSTNDSAIILSSCLAKNKIISDLDENYKKFANVLTEILKELAKMIVKDGEGATKFIAIKVQNAKTLNDAKKVGFSVAKSTLVKTAFFGEDANWGRIICAVGYSGVKINPSTIDIYIDNIKVVSEGKAEIASEDELKQALKKNEIKVIIDLKQGNYSQEVCTSDLSYNYVKINASYRT